LQASQHLKKQTEEMMKLTTRLAVVAMVVMGLWPAAVYADTVTFTLTNASQSVYYLGGGSVTYDATVSAPSTNSAAVYLNGESHNFSGPGNLDDSDFNNFPLSLTPNTSFTGDLFVLTIPANSRGGTYLGSFTLQGGADSAATNTLGTVNFSLTVTTPEPSSVVLLLAGMAGLAMVFVLTRFKGHAGGWAR
jgi:hypothetical protein